MDKEQIIKMVTPIIGEVLDKRGFTEHDKYIVREDVLEQLYDSLSYHAKQFQKATLNLFDAYADHTRLQLNDKDLRKLFDDAFYKMKRAIIDNSNGYSRDMEYVMEIIATGGKIRPFGDRGRLSDRSSQAKGHRKELEKH